LRNWAGNLTYSTGRVYAPDRLDRVPSIVKAEPKLRVLGTRHCFNPIADSSDALLWLRAADDDPVKVDRQKRTATFHAGMTYSQLCRTLNGQGFALHNLASLPHISVAGACSTATHGSGQKNGNLATAVAAFEIATASGKLVKLSRQKDGETFRGAVVGLGALGAITRITLAVQPAFEMRQYVYENLPFQHVEKNFDAIEASAYSVSLFTDWRHRYANQVWVKARREDGDLFDGPPEFFGAKRAIRKLHPVPGIPSEKCTEQMGMLGPWHERLPHFRPECEPSAGEELQSEYFVPRQHAVEAILAIDRLARRLGDRMAKHLMISEIRTIAEDSLWLSPCYGRASVAIHFTWQPHLAAVEELMPPIEKALAPFNPRPHLGKLFAMRPPELRAAYEKLPDFIRLCDRFDPERKFRNPFLERYIFGS